MTMRMWRYALGGLAAAFLAIQLVPGAGADNPPVEGVVDAPEEVVRILRQSCWDCHSNETEWPWYSHVAPASWLVRGDVAEARDELNFTAWDRYDADERVHAWEEVAEEVGDGNMPLPAYLFMHRDARLTDADRDALVAWALRLAEADQVEAEDDAAPPSLP